MNLTCQHCGRDLSQDLRSYGKRRRSEVVSGTLAGQFGGHFVNFCNSLCRDQWDRLEGLAQKLADAHRWEIKPAMVFEPGDGAEGHCSCTYQTGLGDEIAVARAMSSHLHAEALAQELLARQQLRLVRNSNERR